MRTLSALMRSIFRCNPVQPAPDPQITDVTLLLDASQFDIVVGLVAGEENLLSHPSPETRLGNLLRPVAYQRINTED